MSEGRADRLRKRRQEREHSESDDGEGRPDLEDTSDGADAPDLSEVSDSSDSSDQRGTKSWTEGPLKEVGTEVRMYLPDDVVDELDYHYTGFKREIKHEHGIEIEKNRHWYPLVAELGVESLTELEPTELLDELRKREYLSAETGTPA